VDAFDSDVIIYAAAPDHPLGRRVAALFDTRPDDLAGIGSVLLLPEVLSKPTRRAPDDVPALAAFLSRLELRPLDQAVAELAVALGAAYGLRAADAVHLATAVAAGADRFVTNNRRDFTSEITEVEVTYPDGLPEPDDLPELDAGPVPEAAGD
jgi:predicted nucleic acid-binding protein